MREMSEHTYNYVAVPLLLVVFVLLALLYVLTVRPTEELPARRIDCARPGNQFPSQHCLTITP